LAWMLTCGCAAPKLPRHLWAAPAQQRGRSAFDPRRMASQVRWRAETTSSAPTTVNARNTRPTRTDLKVAYLWAFGTSVVAAECLGFSRPNPKSETNSKRQKAKVQNGHTIGQSGHTVASEPRWLGLGPRYPFGGPTSTSALQARQTRPAWLSAAMALGRTRRWPVGFGGSPKPFSRAASLHSQLPTPGSMPHAPRFMAPRSRARHHLDCGGFAAGLDWACWAVGISVGLGHVW
jgi:hypothetical protein